MKASCKAEPKAKRSRGRQPFLSTAFELPIAPSANGLWLNVAGHGRTKAPAYRAWLQEAGWMLKEQHVPRVTGTVALTLLAGLPERPRDIDNLLKATCDLLQINGVVENDVKVCEVFAKWDRTVPSGFMRIEVRQALAPELRMSSEARQRLSLQRKPRCVAEASP